MILSSEACFFMHSVNKSLDGSTIGGDIYYFTLSWQTRYDVVYIVFDHAGSNFFLLVSKTGYGSPCEIWLYWLWIWQKNKRKTKKIYLVHKLDKLYVKEWGYADQYQNNYCNMRKLCDCGRIYGGTVGDRCIISVLFQKSQKIGCCHALSLWAEDGEPEPR